MSRASVKYYKKRLVQEHVRLILDDDPAKADVRMSKIEDYRDKLNELGVAYDPVSRDWVSTE